MKINTTKAVKVGTLASLLTLYSPHLVDAGEARKSAPISGSSLEQTVKIDAEMRNISKKVADGLKEISRGRDSKGYRKAYNIFVDAYNDAVKKDESKDVYKGFAIIAAMHAGKVLLDSGNNIIEGRPLGDIYKGNNLKRALEHYSDALKLKIQLDGKGNPVPIVYTPEVGFMKVADEKLIRRRIAEAYQELIDLTKGRERMSYQKSLIQTYNRLAQLTDGTERFNYEARAQSISTQLKQK